VTDTDVIVIGAGAAGVEAALVAAASGARVTVVSDGPVGGTCVHSGCVPSNVMLHAAEAHAREAASGHWFDLAAVQLAAGRVAERMASGAQRSLSSAGVELVTGRARLTPGGVRVTGAAGDRDLTAAATIIATGAKTRVPDLGQPVGDKRVLSSTDALSLDKLPKRAAVVLGGPLGLEWASFLSNAGAEVTVLEEAETLRSVDDEEAATYLADVLSRRGIQVRTGTRVARLTCSAEEVVLSLETDGDVGDLAVDAVVFGDFRTPDTASLGLDAIGVKTDAAGAVIVDPMMRTSIPRIYAAGDATGAPYFAARARAQGRVAAQNCTGDGIAFRERAVPRALHTTPEAASVGITPAEAAGLGIKTAVGYAEFATSPRAMALGESDGIVKLLADTATGEILGASIIGADAADLIALIALAVDNELTVEDLARMPGAHPSLAELVAQAATGALTASI
jgi:dihydrolipoamide dehydrogenase